MSVDRRSVIAIRRHIRHLAIGTRLIGNIAQDRIADGLIIER